MFMMPSVDRWCVPILFIYWQILINNIFSRLSAYPHYPFDRTYRAIAVATSITANPK